VLLEPVEAVADDVADEVADEVAAGVVDVDEVLLVTADEHAASADTASARTATAATRRRGRTRRPASEDGRRECPTTA
jgi:hypothetical protein